MDNEKIIELIKILTEKTMNNKLNWKKNISGYTYSFPQYSIIIDLKDTNTFIRILNTTGETIVEYSAEQLQSAGVSIEELYSFIKGQDSNIEKALDNMINFLNTRP